jgi:hypothetical protein
MDKSTLKSTKKTRSGMAYSAAAAYSSQSAATWLHVQSFFSAL